MFGYGEGWNVMFWSAVRRDGGGRGALLFGYSYAFKKKLLEDSEWTLRPFLFEREHARRHSAFFCSWRQFVALERSRGYTGCRLVGEADWTSPRGRVRRSGVRASWGYIKITPRCCGCRLRFDSRDRVAVSDLRANDLQRARRKKPGVAKDKHCE